MERSMNEQEKSREIQREEDMSQGQTVIPADRQTERERESNRLDFQTGGKKRQRDAIVGKKTRQREGASSTQRKTEL